MEPLWYELAFKIVSKLRERGHGLVRFLAVGVGWDIETADENESVDLFDVFADGARVIRGRQDDGDAAVIKNGLDVVVTDRDGLTGYIVFENACNADGRGPMVCRALTAESGYDDDG